MRTGTAICIGFLCVTTLACAGHKPVSGAGDEVISTSYPIYVMDYRTSVAIRCTPEQLGQYFLQDLSWVERAAGSLHVVLDKKSRGVDMSKPGSSIDFKIKLLGIGIPCTMTTLKYDSNRDLWLMITTRGTWILWRIRIKPNEEGILLDGDMIGQVSPLMDRFLDALDLVEAGAERFDTMLAVIQSEFDPDLDPKELTSRGLRGDFSRGVFQGYEASVHISSPPAKVALDMGSEPGAIRKLLPMLDLPSDCGAAKGPAWKDPGRSSYCMATFKAGKLSAPAGVVTSGERNGRSVTHYTWVMVSDVLMKTSISVEPEGLGSRLSVVVATELPADTDPMTTDLMVAISELPSMLEAALK